MCKYTQTRVVLQAARPSALWVERTTRFTLLLLRLRRLAGHAADALLASVSRRAWEPVTWAEGAKGQLHAKAYALRCYRGATG